MVFQVGVLAVVVSAMEAKGFLRYSLLSSSFLESQRLNVFVYWLIEPRQSP